MSWRDEQRSHRRWRLENVRGDQLVGNAMERRALGSELDGNPAERRAIWNWHRLHLSPTTIWYAEFRVSLLYRCNADLV